jgi:hypothetical protein
VNRLKEERVMPFDDSAIDHVRWQRLMTLRDRRGRSQTVAANRIAPSNTFRRKV